MFSVGVSSITFSSSCCVGGSALVVLDTCVLTFSLVVLLLSGGGGELLEIWFVEDAVGLDFRLVGMFFECGSNLEALFEFVSSFEASSLILH